MAFWRGSRYATKKVDVNFGDGMNTKTNPLNLKDSELIYSENMSNREYPSLNTRYGHSAFTTEFYSTSASTNGAYSYMINGTTDYLHVVAPNIGWQINWGASTFQIQGSFGLPGSLFNFKNGSINYTIYWSGNKSRYYDNLGTFATTSLAFGDANTPISNISTAHKNRIFALKGNELYYCALSNINDWTTANNAGVITLSPSGNTIAIESFKDKLIIFATNGIQELYGDSPDNFQVIDIHNNAGCIDKDSIAKNSDYIFWAGGDGIYKYDGASTVMISEKINKFYYNKNNTNRYRGGVYKGKYFICFNSNYASTGNVKTFIYDTIMDSWWINNDEVFAFSNNGSQLYNLDKNKNVYAYVNESLEEGDALSTLGTVPTQTAFSWNFETKMFNEGVGENQSLNQMRMVCEGSSNTSVKIEYTTRMYSTHSPNVSPTTQDTWSVIPSSFGFSSLSTESYNNLSIVTGIVRLPSTILANDKYYRLKFSGSGPFKLHRLEKWYRVRK